MIQKYFEDLRRKLGLSDEVPASEIIVRQRDFIEEPR
jgi:hypothetical protein